MGALGNKLLIVYGVADMAFLLSGGLILGFALMSKHLMSSTPTIGNVAQDLLLGECPLNAAIANAALVFLTFALSIPAAILPSSRGWLRAQGWAVVVSACFTLILGLFIWFDTLKTRANLGVIWAHQDPTSQSLLQQKFSCCGYLNATTPLFVTDSTCPNKLIAQQQLGCVGPFSNFANGFLDIIFTAAFGIVGLDVILLLCVAMLIKRREELERYRHIDEKIAFGGF